MSNNKFNIDEGYIKFKCEWINEPLQFIVPLNLKVWRDKMHELKQIGHYPELNIGYGNISVKTSDGIIISGTQTGAIFPIKDEHFTLISQYDINENLVICKGSIQASSESMTHAAIYETDLAIQAIIHIHNHSLWLKLIDKVPTTNKDVPYGTPEMAFEIYRLFKTTTVKQDKIIVMAGHEEGIIVFGNNLEEAAEIVFKYLNYTTK